MGNTTTSNANPARRDIFFQPLTPAFLFLVFLGVDFPYQFGFRNLDLLTSLQIIFVNATFYTFILFVTTRCDLARVTLCFLALPYLIFIAGWLNLPTAIAVAGIFIFCFTRTFRSTTSTSANVITLQDLFAFLLILIWVNLSGIGGYGYQTPDYAIHSTRLKDLVDYSWPVRYGENQNFIFYIGYFLPSALIGKLSSTDIALRSMYPWTIFGITLALRWLSVLSRWQFSALLVGIFVLFGPLDIVNVWVLDHYAAVPFNSALAEMLVNSDYLDFRSRLGLEFFIGNYVSNTFQLYWSPHQVIASWLTISLLTYLFFEKQTEKIIFIYALLCLWSPLSMMALLPFVIVIAGTALFGNWRRVITFDNTVGAGVLIILFLVFYFSGSVNNNPASWLFNSIDWRNTYPALLLFYLCGWGVYVAVATPFVVQEKSTSRIWFACLATTLLALSLFRYGTYADLLCRGSAALMFLLLVFLLRILKDGWLNKRYPVLVMLACLLTLGSSSALLHLHKALQRYGETTTLSPLTHYSHAAENLGPDDSPFNRWFRKTNPHD